jgi:hypothetical protein
MEFETMGFGDFTGVRAFCRFWIVSHRLVVQAQTSWRRRGLASVGVEGLRIRRDKGVVSVLEAKQQDYKIVSCLPCLCHSEHDVACRGQRGGKTL